MSKAAEYIQQLLHILATNCAGNHFVNFTTICVSRLHVWLFTHMNNQVFVYFSVGLWWCHSWSWWNNGPFWLSVFDGHICQCVHSQFYSYGFNPKITSADLHAETRRSTPFVLFTKRELDSTWHSSTLKFVYILDEKK